MYECAVTLVSLSQAPSAIRAAANCYCQLLVSQSDNNVKLIVLERLQELKEKHREVMQDVMMDILRALSSPNMDIRKKTLDISMDLITSRNIDEVRLGKCCVMKILDLLNPIPPDPLHPILISPCCCTDCYGLEERDCQDAK